MLNYTIIKLSLLLIVGIIIGNYFQFSPASLLLPGILFLTLFGISYFRTRRFLLQDIFFGISAYVLFIFIGITTATIHRPQNNPNHFTHFSTEGTTELIIAEVHERLKPGSFQDRYIVKTKELNFKPVSGKLLLNITRDSAGMDLRPGERVAVASEVTKINKPLNPYQFDYSNYMEDLGVLRQVNVSKSEVLLLPESNSGIREVAGNIRGNIVLKLEQFSFEADELAIIQALLLGQRQEVSQEIYSNYAAAGVIHILAVSGLHVGIILLLLNRILQPIERFPKGRIVKAILLILLLWGFALLAGLSPSVVRAVSMFSFVAIGMQLNRRTSVLNTLFISLLVLLLINPGYLTQVGFQLSYAAVLSIVLIQPHLYNLYKGESRAIKYLWGILSVTIAAQIGVLPLSLFYFHQFPGLFFLSNLLILPFLGIILGTGILVMLLALLNILPKFLADAFGWMIESLNLIVEIVAAEEDFIFQNISFSLALCITSYFVVVGLILLLKKISYRRIVFFLIAIAVLQISFISEEISAEGTEAFMFHKSRNTVIGVKRGKELHLAHNLEDTPMSFSFIKNYSVEKDIQEIENLELRNIFSINNKLILRIDSSGIYNIPQLNPEIILLTNSPRINLERVIDTLQPKIIIADGSNYPSAINRWKKTVEKKKLPFHATGEKGAFKFEPSAEGN